MLENDVTETRPGKKLSVYRKEIEHAGELLQVLLQHRT